MKAIRSVLFWTHLCAGVIAGVVILVMSITGAVLALRPQIQNSIDRDVRYVEPGATRLEPHELLSRIAAARPRSVVQSVALVSDPKVAALVGVNGEGNVYVNPYTGAILGPQSRRAIDFFQTATSWHRYMAATGDYRDSGRMITGASNFAFLILGLTGMYIWWPKQLTLRHIRPIVWFRAAATSRGRDFNWHHTFGFWTVLPIIVMTASGVVMSYSWANTLVYTLTGSPVPVRTAGPGGRTAAAAEGARRGGGETIDRRDRVEKTDSVVPETINQLFATATAQVPTWSQLSMRLPNRVDGAVTFTITDGAQWNQFARSQLTLNARGDVVQWQPYDKQSLGQKVRGWLRFAHTGELGGAAGQIIAGIGCIGGVVLVYTGLALAWRRLVNWSLWARLGVRERREKIAA
jgi:uncharacterized iron-regulated membrane protein